MSDIERHEHEHQIEFDIGPVLTAVLVGAMVTVLIVNGYCFPKVEKAPQSPVTTQEERPL